jgi:flotillin
MFDISTLATLGGLGALGGAFALWVFIAMLFRVVVSTNDVHIVQSAKKTVSYGKDQAAGNTYYKWPAWIPVIGVKTIVLPVSVFDLTLDGYSGYDKGRVPFEIDIMAYFRIDNSAIAAQRVHSFEMMKEQLEGLLQGATRSILAKSDIEEILEERAKFGEMFTEAVREQLKEWGVINVKNIELMDIRDGEGSKAIENIMAKKKSLIERESRMAVAENNRAAQEAEIVAKRQVALAAQEAEQQVGQRTADKEKAVGIAKEKAQQDIKVEAKITAEKDMEVVRVKSVKQAEIEKDVAVVTADQDKQVVVIKATADKEKVVIQATADKEQKVIHADADKEAAVKIAEGQKQKTILAAEGKLEEQTKNAKGLEAEGLAKGVAEQAVLMAPVNAQIALAEKIDKSDGYQEYLLGIRRLEAVQHVGVAQAEALKAAGIKIIANTGNPVEGVSNVMDLFSSKGGTQISGLMEALAQSDAGAALLKKFGIAPKDAGTAAAHAGGDVEAAHDAAVAAGAERTDTATAVKALTEATNRMAKSIAKGNGLGRS